MFSDGFTDLRMNHQNGQGDDSFWPSFTDVMTVIVMIFLLAMVVVMMRNSELIQQLRSTMEAEREAAELARATSEEKEGLAMRLVEAEQKLSMLRLEMMRVTEQRDEARSSLTDKTQALAALSAELQSTRANLKARETELDQTRLQLSQATEQRDVLASQLKQATSQLTSNQQQLASLQEKLDAQQQQLQSTTTALEAKSNQLAVLGGEYDELKIKYDKLVRPARTPRGKFVVEVKITKQSGKIQIGLKNLADKNFTAVSESKLHERLTALKKQYPKTLYVKIIFPEDSKLSHTEAWSYTNSLHKKYDYYFQE